MPPETPLPNDPASRTPDGTLKDQGALTPPPTDSSTTEAGSKTETDGSPPQKTETPAKQPTDGKSALTDTGTTPAGAPEKYEDFKVPDGYELDKTAIEKVLPIFKEIGLNQEQAQKLVDQYAEISKESAEAPVKFYADMQKEWRQEATSRFGKALEPGGAIVTEFDTAITNALPPTLAKNFRAALDFTGIGNHPDFIEAFRVMAKPWLTGTHVSGKNPSPDGQKAPGEAPKSIAAAMYPHLPSASSGR